MMTKLIMLSCMSVPAVLGAATVYTEDFTAVTVQNKANPYLGGWFSPQVSFGEWVGSTSDVWVSGGALITTTTSGQRHAAVVLSPTLLPGAGAYTLVFDLTGFAGDADDFALARVWSASGYDLSLSSADAVVVDTLSGQLIPSGAAVAQLLAAGSYQSTATDLELSFHYDGVSALVLFFGASTGGWPFPTATWDNVRLLDAAAIPEPGRSVLLWLAALLLCLGRRSRGDAD